MGTDEKLVPGELLTLDKLQVMLGEKTERIEKNFKQIITHKNEETNNV